MYRLFLVLLIAALGGSLIIHFLKNYLLKEKIRLRLDWDGMLERTAICSLLIFAPDWWTIIPAIVLLRVLFQLYLLSSFSRLNHTSEPGMLYQQVLYKSEFAFEILASPLFAIIVGVIFQ